MADKFKYKNYLNALKLQMHLKQFCENIIFIYRNLLKGIIISHNNSTQIHNNQRTHHSILNELVNW